MAALGQLKLWAALQRRFEEQDKARVMPEKLVRAIMVVPLDGQEGSATWSLGFKETGEVRRTTSLSRDFQSIAALVPPRAPAYLLLYVGDLQGSSAGGGKQSNWAVIAWVPPSCSAAESKKMADNRSVLKAGLGAGCFSGDMWCTAPEQITLSNYIKSMDGRAAAAPAEEETDEQAVRIQALYRGKRGRKRSASVAQGRPSSPPSQPPSKALPLRHEEAGATEATDEIWEERIHGVRSGYVDSCRRLSSALEELEQALCSLTGDAYRPDEPLLHVRAHINKKIEIYEQPAGA